MRELLGWLLCRIGFHDEEHHDFEEGGSATVPGIRVTRAVCRRCNLFYHHKEGWTSNRREPARLVGDSTWEKSLPPVRQGPPAPPPAPRRR